MRYIVFDIETKNTFQDVGGRDASLLDISIVGAYDSTEGTYESYTEEELEKLWPKIEQTDVLIGYNSDHFDIPLLAKYYHGDLGRIKSIDIMRTIYNALGRRIGLGAVAEATLGVGKSGHGLQAITWWKNGEIDKIRKYCIDDVRVTHNLYSYIRTNKLIKFHNGKAIQDLKLDISDWEEIEESKMTQSLPF